VKVVVLFCSKLPKLHVHLRTVYLSVATCEGGRIVLQQITCTFNNCLPVFKSHLEFIIQLSILMNVLKTSSLKLNIS
jgi:hypothetical protein